MTTSSIKPLEDFDTVEEIISGAIPNSKAIMNSYNRIFKSKGIGYDPKILEQKKAGYNSALKQDEEKNKAQSKQIDSFMAAARARQPFGSKGKKYNPYLNDFQQYMLDELEYNSKNKGDPNSPESAEAKRKQDIDKRNEQTKRLQSRPGAWAG